MLHVLAEQRFVEIVVSGRDRSVYRIERRRTHQLHRLCESQPLVDVIAQSLDVNQCGVPFVAVIDLLSDAQRFECHHASYSEQNLLLEPVFIVASVEMVRNESIILAVQAVVRVE